MGRINDKLQIYLAGRMNGISFEEMNAWRKEIKQKLLLQSMITDCDIVIVNPVDFYNYKNIRHQNELEIMNFDLVKVKTSDIIIINMEGLNESIGSCIECYEAYKNGIPVLAFGGNDLFMKLHPWIQNCITRYEKTDNDIVNYIRDFYMN